MSRANTFLAFAREPLDGALLDAMAPLLKRHWAEVGHYPDIPLEVDAGVYLGAEANGQLRIFTARDGGRLVGYAAYFVRPNPHYASSVQAVEDVIFVAPECRGSTGARLIRFADDALRAEGVQAVYHHVKLAHNWGPLLERMGYEPIDVIYGKRLDGWTRGGPR